MEKLLNKSLFTRIVSAIVFAIVFAIAFINKFSYLIVFIFFMLQSLWEFYNITNNNKLKPNKIFGLFVAFSIFLTFFLYKAFQINIFLLPLLFLFTILILSIFIEKNFFESTTNTIFGVIYIAIPFSFSNLLVFKNGNFEIINLLTVFGFIWIFDIFSYFSGILFGKHKLAANISPKKTIEGAVGGFLLTILSSIAFYYLFKKIAILDYIFLASLVAISSLFGDLFESKIKRNFNIKDSGKIMPGHGGLLDRFDSFLFSIIFATIFLKTINAI